MHRGYRQGKLFIVITMLFMAVVVTGAFLASRFIERLLVNQLIENYNEQESVAAQQVAQIIELEIKGVEDRLRLAAQFPEIVIGDPVACNAKLRQLLAESEGKLGNLGRVGLDGKFHCSVNEALIGIEAATLGQYITDAFEDPQHKTVMSRAIKPVGATSYLVGLHVPVWGSGGEFLGTLGGALYFDNLQEAYLERQVFSEGGFIALYDDDGTVLYRPEVELIGRNVTSPEFTEIVGSPIPFQEMIASARDNYGGTKMYFANGTKKIAAFEPIHPVEGRTWIVVVSVPMEEVNAALGSVGVSKFLAAMWLFNAALVGVGGLLMMYFLMKFVFLPAQAIDKAKTEFVSLASHQLRTPLSAINWYTEMLLAGDAGRITKEQREFLQQVAQSNKRMVDLVGSLLNVSRIDLGTFAVDPVPTNFADVALSVIAELGPQITDKQLVVTTDFDAQVPLIPADPKLLRIIFQNLLSNAVKYTPNKGKVLLSITLDKAAKEVKVTVMDTGFGIPQEAQSKIFTKLYRADNARAKDADGNGLGLYIVKSIVEQSNGKIWFESQENKGTTFFVTLPLSGMQKKSGAKALET